MYSFIEVKKKPLFAEDTKLWLLFISAVSALMVGFSLFIATQAYFYMNDTKKLKKELIKNKQQVEEFNKKIAFIEKEQNLYTNININNALLKDGVKNLLDLIPDPITLTNIKIEKNSLILYGITPTKDVYNILLLPPLKSIFTETKTNFYQMKNGWYRFESINHLKEEKE
jgi:hypothetical protein